MDWIKVTPWPRKQWPDATNSHARYVSISWLHEQIRFWVDVQFYSQIWLWWILNFINTTQELSQSQNPVTRMKIRLHWNIDPIVTISTSLRTQWHSISRLWWSIDLPPNESSSVLMKSSTFSTGGRLTRPLFRVCHQWSKQYLRFLPPAPPKSAVSVQLGSPFLSAERNWTHSWNYFLCPF